MKSSKNTVKMKLSRNLIVLIIYSVLCSFSSYSQSISHPCIWVNAEEKVAILDKIETYAWAKSLETQLHTRVDASKNTHKANPSAFLSEMPAIGSSTTRDAHNQKVTLAVESATLYYLTSNEDYAQLSADILSYYTEALSKADSLTIVIYNDIWHEARNEYSKLAMTYDFIYPYIKKAGGITVYDNILGTRIPFNNANAQTTMQFMAVKTLNSCASLQTNHSLLSGRGALFPIIMIEDDATREKFLDHFINNPRNTSYDPFTWTLNHFSEDNIWPESFDYSVYPSIMALEEMEVLDRLKPELNIISNNIRILEGIFSFENQIYPSKIASMNYGDSDRRNTVPDELYTRALAIAKRKGYTDLSKKIGEMLKFKYSAKTYAPTIETETIDWTSLLQLLWDKDFSLYSSTPITYETVFPVTHAGITVQRNINCTDEKDHGMMGYIGGATFVHGHLQGIDLELYGAGYVLGAVGGLNASRDADEFVNYSRIYAGHNTVIVNGTSRADVKSGFWGNYQDKPVLEASEPRLYGDPISENFSFATQLLNDDVNSCVQQRTLSIIRTSPTSGYYFDMFRSRSNGLNDFHDYIYHNIGEGVKINFSNNVTVPLTSSTRYSSSIMFNNKPFPGWHFFESVKSSAETDNGIKVQISAKYTQPSTTYTHISIPSGTKREYSSAMGPQTLHGEAGYTQYSSRKTPILAIRKNGEAWNSPFIATFEMTRNSTSSIQSTTEIKNGDIVVGAKVVSLVDGVTITDWVICQESASEVLDIPNEGIHFTGRFAIIRQELKVGKFTETLYIGDGKSLTYGLNSLTADAENKGLKTYDRAFDPNDTDNDGILNDVDNCPSTFNPDQSDMDNDGIGNICDDDIDGDGFLNEEDFCPLTFSTEQIDADADGIDDACDDYLDDYDNDGIKDIDDNCSTTPNFGQEDYNNNGIGDACDPELSIFVSETISETGSNAWTCKDGVTQIKVECWGAGGAGGTAKSVQGVNANHGGGGAGGAYAQISEFPVVPGNAYNFVVGDCPFVIKSSVKINGNATWFHTPTTVFAEGGEGGTPAYAVSPETWALGGEGSKANSIGDITYKGGDGMTPNGASNAGGGGGSAGNASDGNNALSWTSVAAVPGGCKGGEANNNGSTSVYPATPEFGSGGGGSYASMGASTPRANGSGGPGRIVITYAVNPMLSTSQLSLSDFNYLVGNGPSAAQNFYLSGSKLQSGFDVDIYGSSNFEVSLDNINFVNKVSISSSTSFFESTPIYVRLKEGLPDGELVSENISVKIKDVTFITMACSGNVGTILPVSQINKNSIKIYPNPANEYFTIELGQIESNVTIINILGVKVFEQQCVKGNIVIPTSKLGLNGLYNININSSNYKILIINR